MTDLLGSFNALMACLRHQCIWSRLRLILDNLRFSVTDLKGRPLAPLLALYRFFERLSDGENNDKKILVHPFQALVCRYC